MLHKQIFFHENGQEMMSHQIATQCVVTVVLKTYLQPIKICSMFRVGGIHEYLGQTMNATDPEHVYMRTVQNHKLQCRP